MQNYKSDCAGTDDCAELQGVQSARYRMQNYRVKVQSTECKECKLQSARYRMQIQSTECTKLQAELLQVGRYMCSACTLRITCPQPQVHVIQVQAFMCMCMISNV
jgi:hypothetical protein